MQVQSILDILRVTARDFASAAKTIAQTVSKTVIAGLRTARACIRASVASATMSRRSKWSPLACEALEA